MEDEPPARGAFPVKKRKYLEGIEIEDLGVFSYLQSVKKQAQSLVYLSPNQLQGIEAPGAAEATEATEATKDTASEDEQVEEEMAPWMEVFMDSFLRMKAKEVPQEAFEEPRNQKEWKQLVTNEPPKYGVIYYFHNTTVIKLIVYFTGWLSRSINENMSLWIYTIFLRLDPFMDIEDMAKIRNLAKKALKLINTPELEDTSHYTCAFILLLTNRYLLQKDYALPPTKK